MKLKNSWLDDFKRRTYLSQEEQNARRRGEVMYVIPQLLKEEKEEEEFEDEKRRVVTCEEGYEERRNKIGKQAYTIKIQLLLFCFGPSFHTCTLPFVVLHGMSHAKHQPHRSHSYSYFIPNFYFLSDFQDKYINCICMIKMK